MILTQIQHVCTRIINRLSEAVALLSPYACLKLFARQFKPAVILSIPQLICVSKLWQMRLSIALYGAGNWVARSCHTYSEWHVAEAGEKPPEIASCIWVTDSAPRLLYKVRVHSSSPGLSHQTILNGDLVLKES